MAAGRIGSGAWLLGLVCACMRFMSEKPPAVVERDLQRLNSALDDVVPSKEAANLLIST